MITIRSTQDDDPAFLCHVRSIFVGCLYEYSPAEAYVVRIRNWFDYRWCHFSGKSLGALGVSIFATSHCLPSCRIASCPRITTSAATDSNAYEPSDAPPLHIHQRSEANQRRFIRRTMNNGAMMWFSSASMATGRGSLMVYCVFSSNLKFGWHITLMKKAEWQIDKVTFTSRPLVEGLRDLGSRMIAIAE